MQKQTVFLDVAAISMPFWRQFIRKYQQEKEEVVSSITEDGGLPDPDPEWDVLNISISDEERLRTLYQRVGGRTFRDIHPLRAGFKTLDEWRAFRRRVDGRGLLVYAEDLQKWVWTRKAVRDFRPCRRSVYLAKKAAKQQASTR